MFSFLPLEGDKLMAIVLNMSSKGQIAGATLAFAPTKGSPEPLFLRAFWAFLSPLALKLFESLQGYL